MPRKLTILSPLLIALACDPAAAGDCTEIGCSSTLTLTLQHDLPLDETVQLTVTTPDHELRCSIDPIPSGSGTCFGFAFADLSWDQEAVNVTLTSPFLSTQDNPDSLPYESVDARLEREGVALASATVTVDAGEADTPNGPDCPPTCWQATGVGDLRQ